MIGFLRGRLIELNGESIILDVQGVGYELHASANTLSDWSAYLQQDLTVWVYTHVREDALNLFGFANKDEKELFLSLLKVNGVGPKMALSILSGARATQVRDFIEAGNAQALSKLPRVGKKTAEQIILTLKGKLVKIEPSQLKSLSRPKTEIVSALTNLGFKLSHIEDFVSTLPEDIELEEGVRKGLQALSNQVSNVR